MAIRLSLTVLFFAGLFAFQNCGKAPMNVGDMSSPEVSAAVDSKTFFFQDDYDRVAEAGVGEFILSVDTGEIFYNPPSVNLGLESLTGKKKFCLDDGEKIELQELLAEDHICVGSPSRDPDTVCAAIYRPSYAKYGSPTQKVVPIGEALSSCQVKSDFCSGQGERVRRIIEQVKATLDSRVCGL